MQRPGSGQGPRGEKHTEGRRGRCREDADLALQESGPFLEGDAARLISELVGRLAEQVRQARSEGRRRVAPMITASAQLLAKSVALAESRNAWLEATVDGRPLVEVLGIDPIDPEARDLRDSAMVSVRVRLLANRDL